MEYLNDSYSPNITIYLKIKEIVIRLSDVLHDTATIYDMPNVSIPSFTKASLVFRINETEEVRNIVLLDNVTQESNLINFKYDSEEELSDFSF